MKLNIPENPITPPTRDPSKVTLLDQWKRATPMEGMFLAFLWTLCFSALAVVGAAILCVLALLAPLLLPAVLPLAYWMRTKERAQSMRASSGSTSTAASNN